MTEPIIKSILDNDLYKFTMMNFALELFPEAIVTYKFKNRGTQRFNQEFIKELQKQINYLANLKLTDKEYLYLKENLTYLTPGHIEYLKNFRYNPSNISIKLTEDNNLELEIKGKWVETILFEVPLMAIISELYFKIIDTDWEYDEMEVKIKASEKMRKLSEDNCLFAEFGTRRRRSFEVQETVVGVFSRFNENALKKNFVGSSNIFLAKKYGLKPIGTMGHEICMCMGVIEGLRNSNYYSLMNWKRIFNGNLGIFLPDTYGVNAFLNNFTLEMAKLYDGVRWDSGKWEEFANKIINHYKKLNINPMSKVIVFSDNLNIEKAVEIKKWCEGKIKCSFGIGTHLTNQGFDTPALNMVIKLNSVFHNGMEVFTTKLSDSPGKEQGDEEALRVARYVFFNHPLDKD